MLRIYRISGSNLIRNSQRFSPVKTNIAENLYNDGMYRYIARIIVIIIWIWHIWQEIMTIINYRFWDSKDELSLFFGLCLGFLKFIEMKIVDQTPTSGIFSITYFRILTRAPSILIFSPTSPNRLFFFDIWSISLFTSHHHTFFF